ncbi:MAG: hypothetical protein JXQ75_09970 [Phycisphaerae bacterium]|nr:hypothetical protein [Phycisphaerae bacterium]
MYKSSIPVRSVAHGSTAKVGDLNLFNQARPSAEAGLKLRAPANPSVPDIQQALPDVPHLTITRPEDDVECAEPGPNEQSTGAIEVDDVTEAADEEVVGMASANDGDDEAAVAIDAADELDDAVDDDAADGFDGGVNSIWGGEAEIDDDVSEAGDGLTADATDDDDECAIAIDAADRLDDTADDDADDDTDDGVNSIWGGKAAIDDEAVSEAGDGMTADATDDDDERGVVMDAADENDESNVAIDVVDEPDVPATGMVFDFRGDVVEDPEPVEQASAPKCVELNDVSDAGAVHAAEGEDADHEIATDASPPATTATGRPMPELPPKGEIADIGVRKPGKAPKRIGSGRLVPARLTWKPGDPFATPSRPKRNQFRWEAMLTAACITAACGLGCIWLLRTILA